MTQVINNIRVLPLSSFDNRIRVAEYRTRFTDSAGLYRYAMGTQPSIHIIVDNGHVTLVGVVDNQADKNIGQYPSQHGSGCFLGNEQSARGRKELNRPLAHKRRSRMAAVLTDRRPFCFVTSTVSADSVH